MEQVPNNPMVPVNQLILFVPMLPMVTLVPVVHTALLQSLQMFQRSFNGSYGTYDIIK
jgi:hypothetical protein